MSNPSLATSSTKIKVGLFTVFGLALIGAITVYVNDRPYWWRSCNLVHVKVEDATGLKTKSPIRSLGLEIGYLRSVELRETFVYLGICLTAPVEVLPNTQAYIRGEGFLGDKFVELKPIRYVGNLQIEKPDEAPVEDGKIIPAPSNSEPSPTQSAPKQEAPKKRYLFNFVPWFKYAMSSRSAFADDKGSTSNTYRSGISRPDGPEIPVGASSKDLQNVVNQVDGLVKEMTDLTSNLKQAIDPNELRDTLRQLNKTLNNASKVLAPEGNLNQTAQRALGKLEDAIEQVRQQVTRINNGEGSLGRIINDPVYADELLKALKNVNKILNRASDVRFVVDLGAAQLPAWDGTRGFFHLALWPTNDRYYLVGVSSDPRTTRKKSTTTTSVGGTSTTVETTREENAGFVFTVKIGKVFFRRLDLSVGLLYGDGTASMGLNLGPYDHEDRIQFHTDVYSRGTGFGIDERAYLLVRPWWTTWVNGGLESFRKINGKTNWMIGAGITFDDEDIKLLFAFR